MPYDFAAQFRTSIGGGFRPMGVSTGGTQYATPGGQPAYTTPGGQPPRSVSTGQMSYAVAGGRPPQAVGQGTQYTTPGVASPVPNNGYRASPTQSMLMSSPMFKSPGLSMYGRF